MPTKNNILSFNFLNIINYPHSLNQLFYIYIFSNRFVYRFLIIWKISKIIFPSSAWRSSEPAITRQSWAKRRIGIGLHGNFLTAIEWFRNRLHAYVIGTHLPIGKRDNIKQGVLCRFGVHGGFGPVLYVRETPDNSEPGCGRPSSVSRRSDDGW